MKGTKDIFKLFSSQAQSNALSTIAAAEDLTKVEISDEDFEEIETSIKSLMTFDAAVNNPKINEVVLDAGRGKILQSAMHNVENHLKKVIAKTSIDIKEIETEGKEQVHDIIDVIGNKIEEVLTNSDGDNEKLIKSYKEDITNLNKEIKQKEEHFGLKEKELKGQFDHDLLKQDFYLYVSKYNWADAYKDDTTKRALIKGMWDDTNSDAKPQKVDGKIVLYQKDFPEKEYMDGNSIVSFQDYIEPKIGPYLQKTETQKPPLPGANGVDVKFENMTDGEKLASEMNRVHG